VLKAAILVCFGSCRLSRGANSIVNHVNKILRNLNPIIGIEPLYVAEQIAKYVII